MESTGNHAKSARGMIVLCAVAATVLGMAYMAAGDAPLSFLAMNGAALGIGIALVAIAAHGRPSVGYGAACLSLAVVLLLTWAIGTSAEGATRWLRLGNVTVQPSLVLVPVLAVCFTRSRDLAAVAGVAVAAVVLALQPDRAMAGALAAGMAALVVVRPNTHSLIAFAAASAAFVVTMVRPDTQGAMPFVDRIYYTAFDVHPLAGLAVVAGSAILLLPAILGMQAGRSDREARAVFGAVWLAAIVAAALGNYPTPLVGYGGSAIVGYLLCALAFPRSATAGANIRAAPTTHEKPDDGHGLLRRA